jgi:beta-propeller repeat-containing protein
MASACFALTRPSTTDYVTYPGGSGAETVAEIAVDSSGSQYVAGTTNSSSLPVTSTALGSPSSTSRCAFLTKFNPAGNRHRTLHLCCQLHRAGLGHRRCRQRVSGRTFVSFRVNINRMNITQVRRKAFEWRSVEDAAQVIDFKIPRNRVFIRFSGPQAHGHSITVEARQRVACENSTAGSH